MIFASLARGTWAKYETAAKFYAECCGGTEGVGAWPLTGTRAARFAIWLSKHRAIKSSTIESYVWALVKLNTWLGFTGMKSKDRIILAAVLKGLKNLESFPSWKGDDEPVNFKILTNLRNWALDVETVPLTDVRQFWGCCLIAFWGSFRISELLAENSEVFDPKSDLVWADVRWLGKSHAQVTVKKPKVGHGPEVVDLFEFPNRKFCPLRALRHLGKRGEGGSSKEDNLPVFRRLGGGCFTRSDFRKLLRTATSPNFVKFRSFRAGVPSLLELSPQLADDRHVKIWGRWKGSSYKRYMRNGLESKKWVWKKIVQACQAWE